MYYARYLDYNPLWTDLCQSNNIWWHNHMDIKLLAVLSSFNQYWFMEDDFLLWFYERSVYRFLSFNDKNKIDPILTVLGFSLICLNVLLAHPNKHETDRWDMCFMAKVSLQQWTHGGRCVQEWWCGGWWRWCTGVMIMMVFIDQMTIVQCWCHSNLRHGMSKDQAGSLFNIIDADGLISKSRFFKSNVHLMS